MHWGSSAVAAMAVVSFGVIAAQESAQQPIFPRPSEPLVLPANAEHPLTLADALAFVTRVTRVTFSYETVVLRRLEASQVQLSADTVVPPEQVYTWVEGLLLQHGYVLGLLSTSEPMLVGVYSSTPVQGAQGQPVLHNVDAEHLDDCRQHPALLVQTVLHLPHVDVRTLGNSLRGLTGNDGSSGILPVANTNSVALTGTGLAVANLVEALREVEAHAAADLEGAGKR